MLKPSRRIPKRLQRPPSALSRHHAARLQNRRSRSALRSRLALFVRRARTSQRNVRALARRLRFLMLFGASGMLLALLALLFLSPLFTVSSMSIRRPDQRVDIEEMQRLLLPFFGRHLLFLSSREVERVVASAYPEVSALTVEKRLPHELRLTLHMEEIGADVLLGDPDDTEEDIATSSGSSLHRSLTVNGIYLEYPMPLSPPLPETKERVPLHIVDWVAKPAHRQQLLSPEILHEMESTLTVLRESFGHSIQSVTLYLRAKEFHVRTERVVLWFDFASPAAAQLDRYRTFLRSLPLTESEKYVDVRLHDRVVYR